MTQPPVQIGDAIVRVIREDWGRILASLARSIGDLQLAEDCLQDATERALTHWGRNGLPRVPEAWLLTTARRRAIDHLRRRNRFDQNADEIAYLQELDAADVVEDHNVISDERLELIFACCHPAIEEKSRIALTLRSLGGLTTEEIAAGFLDKPATMAQRLSRAKSKIKLAGIPFRLPESGDLSERLSGVMRVLYLIFNEGYHASSGTGLTRVSLSDEAIRLGRVLVSLLPDEPELKGLLALMLFADARRDTREDDNGVLVPLENQDRARWERDKIREGAELLAHLPLDGAYQLQAAINAEHAVARSWKETDWSAISDLYERLDHLEPNPVIRLNRATALCLAGDLGAAEALLKDVETAPGMDQYQPFFVARAELYHRQGKLELAIRDLDRALGLTTLPGERAFLSAKRKKMTVS